jgi:hypothetical protein
MNETDRTARGIYQGESVVFSRRMREKIKSIEVMKLVRILSLFLK